jgi:hypothetical protein
VRKIPFSSTQTDLASGYEEIVRDEKLKISSQRKKMTNRQVERYFRLKDLHGIFSNHLFITSFHIRQPLILVINW